MKNKEGGNICKSTFYIKSSQIADNKCYSVIDLENFINRYNQLNRVLETKFWLYYFKPVSKFQLKKFIK